VRTATADRDDLIAALRSDLAWLEGGRRPSSRRTSSGADARQTAAKKTAKKTAARRAR
jgi:hypothetical protein